ncbi:MAG TPA: magnesium transporter [Erysipelotrichaceae bacterium]|nr:magnesium transporter [Erysipelotrichia bacterium]HPX32106.1 magnesium transporter [Erysipelotrichaceae bacterium]HQA84561.1 magnesium transporter [Erysipelotrichaceae bacterium]
MANETRLTNPEYVAEIIDLLNQDLTKKQLQNLIIAYHASDIADALEELDKDKRLKIFEVVDDEQLSEIFAYLEDADIYINEIDLQLAAQILSEMDSDDAVDVLEEIEDEEIKDQILEMMDEESSEDVLLIQSYDEDTIGSMMTTNYIEIHKDLSIKDAMRALTAQAKDNDNVSTIYVVDEHDKFYGAIDLKDLIIAREGSPLENIITNSYPTVYADALISHLLEDLKDYSEDSYPVLDRDDHIIGIITATDIVEMVEDELVDDYAKLGGLTSEEDLSESIFQSVKKRIPWLMILLILGLGISSVVGVFETVVQKVPLIICFQSLILGMAGNVGTQSLAVTVRVLMVENLTTKEKFMHVLKEVKIGLTNGLLLATLSIVVVTAYIMLFKINDIKFSLLIGLCVALALIITLIVSSLMGTLVPITFHSINIDPAVASGPLITTLNDLVAVIVYYGLSWLLIIQVFNMV